MATVRYFVTDVGSSIEYYRKNLGFVVTQNWGGNFAKIQLDDLELWISGPNTSAAMPMTDGSKPIPGGWNRLVIKVNNIETIVEKLKEEGIKMRNEILTGVGGKQILIEDPSGNPIELFQEK